MNDIRQWVLTISTVSIISGAVVSLLPKSSHKNLYKVITVIIMVYAFIQPFAGSKGVDFRINDYLSDNYSVSREIDKYAVSSIVDSAEKAINNLLSEESAVLSKKYTYKSKCKIVDEQIIVEKITVLPKPDENDLMKIEEIAEHLGFDSKVIVYEGDGNEY